MKEASHKNKYCTIPPMWGHLEKSNSIETENRMVVSKGHGGEMRRYCLMGIVFQFCKMDKSLKTSYKTI